VRRVVVDDFNIGREAGTRVCAFDEVVREQGVAWEAAVEHRVEGRDFVDALAGEDALAVEVLVDVGDGACVDIEACFAGEEGGQARARGGLHADADPRLQDAVAMRDDATLGVDDGAVERMRHGADHRCGGAARQLRVGVEGDDVANVAYFAYATCLDRERVECTFEKLVQVEQLAALALPAHPYALACVEGAQTVEECEAAAALPAVTIVQLVDEIDGQLDQWVVVVLTRLGDRIRKIGDEREVQVGVLVGEIADFEFGNQLTQLRLVHEQCGHGDKCACFFGNAGAVEVDLGEGAGFKQSGDGVVDEVDDALRDGQDQEHEGPGEIGKAVRLRHDRYNQRGDEQDGQDFDGRDVEEVGVVARGDAYALEQRRAVAGSVRQRAKAVVNEIEADVRLAEIHARVDNGALLRLGGQAERFARDLKLGHVGVAGQAGHAFAIRFAAVEVHLRVGAGGVFAEHVVKQDQRLGHNFPVGVAQLAEAFDAGLDNRIQARLLRGVQDGFAFADRAFREVQLEEGGQRPELLQREGLDGLRLFHVDAQGISVPDEFCGSEVAFGHQCDAGQTTIAVGLARQHAQGAQTTGNLIDRRAQQTRVFAQDQEGIGCACRAIGLGECIELAYQSIERTARCLGAWLEAALAADLPLGMPAVSVGARLGTQVVFVPGGGQCFPDRCRSCFGSTRRLRDIRASGVLTLRHSQLQSFLISCVFDDAGKRARRRWAPRLTNARSLTTTPARSAAPAPPQVVSGSWRPAFRTSRRTGRRAPSVLCGRLLL
jgi:hypothetical protein